MLKNELSDLNCYNKFKNVVQILIDLPSYYTVTLTLYPKRGSIAVLALSVAWEYSTFTYAA